MNRQKWLVFWVVSALTGGAGVFLNHRQASCRLGNPGLKMIEHPVFDEERRLIGTNTVDLPQTVPGFASAPIPVSLAELSWLPKDTTYGFRRYQAKDGFWTDIRIVLMGKDRTSIHKPQICLTGQGWKIDQSELLTVRIPKPAPYDLPIMKLTASKAVLDSGQKATYRALFVYWFVSENRMTARHAERMWWMAADLLKTGVLPRWAYIAYFSVCRPGQEAATFARMKEFMAASVPEFQLVSGVPGAVTSAAVAVHP